MTPERERHSGEHNRRLVDAVTMSAMALVREDGTVVIHDEEGEFIPAPSSIIDTMSLPISTRRTHLHHIADVIESTVLKSLVNPRGIDIANLACWLAPYRAQPAFIRQAASLIVVNEQGIPIRVAAARIRDLAAHAQP